MRQRLGDLGTGQTVLDSATQTTFTGSHRDAFCGGTSLNRLREEMFRYRSMELAGVAFQACLIDRSTPASKATAWPKAVAP